jgi:hypothetical protein
MAPYRPETNRKNFNAGISAVVPQRLACLDPICPASNGTLQDINSIEANPTVR